MMAAPLAEERFAAHLVLMTADQLRELATFCAGLPSDEARQMAAVLRELAHSRDGRSTQSR